jgi:hypothetical protein
VAFAAPEGKTTLAVFNRSEGDRTFQVEGWRFLSIHPARSQPGDVRVVISVDL